VCWFSDREVSTRKSTSARISWQGVVVGVVVAVDVGVLVGQSMSSLWTVPANASATSAAAMLSLLCAASGASMARTLVLTLPPTPKAHMDTLAWP